MTASKSRRRLREETRQLYREAILDAAERVFSRAGFEGARMADVATEAGLGTGTLYNYFRNKDDVFRSLLEHLGNDFLERLHRIVDPREDQPTEKRTIDLGALIRAAFEEVERHRAMFSLLLEMGAVNESGYDRVGGRAVADIYGRYMALHREAIEGAIACGRLRPDVAPETLVAFLTGAMSGITRKWLADGSTEPLADHASEILELFVKGAGPSR